MADDTQYDINNLLTQARLSTFGTGGSPLLNPAFSNMGQGDPYSVIQGDPSQSITGPPPTDPAALMNPALRKQMATPNLKTDVEDKFNELLAKYPQHTPASVGRTIVAALAGFKGGPDASQKIIDEPFNQAVADWKNQAGPAYQAANLERQGNINERQIAAQQNAYETASQRNEIAQEKNRQAYQIAQDKLTIQRAIEEGTTFITKDVPYIMASRKDGTLYSTGVPTTNKDAMELAEANNKSKAQIAAGHDAARIQSAGISAGGANARAGTLVHQTMPDGSVVSGYTHPVTGEFVPLTQADGTPVGDLTKVGPAGKGGSADAQAKIQESARTTLDALNEMLDDKGKLRPNIASVVGAGRYNPANWIWGGSPLPGTDNVTAEATIKRFKSVQVLDLIEKIKAQSKIGATGFGRLTDKDLEILGRAATKLDPAMPTADFEAELVRIRGLVQKALQPTDGLNPTKTPKKMTPQNLWDKYGGKD
jgi:hypothetical protein